MSGIPTIAMVVEGHGEVSAGPVLVRRLLGESQFPGIVLKPHRVPKSQMPRDMARAVRLQLNRVGARGGVVVLLDADDDDPAALAAGLRSSLPDDLVPRTRVVVAVREYEAWFLAGIESLRGHHSIRSDAMFDGDPEVPRDAKGRLAAQMLEAYQETIHQVAFSAIVDLTTVKERSPSFRELWACVRGLAGGVT